MLFSSFPCKNCGDRKAGCHSSCEKYKEARAAHDKAVAEFKQTDKGRVDIDAFKFEVVTKTKEKYQRRK